MAKTFTTRSGHIIDIMPIPQLQAAKVQQANQKKAQELYPATAPTYTVPLMGGGVQTFQHDDESAQTPEEKAAMAEYKANLAKQATFLSERMLKFYFVKGTKIKLPEDNGWAELEEAFGVEVPSEPLERLFHYIMNELLVDAEDIGGLTNAIMEETGVDKETLDAARASFRGVVGKETNAVGPTDRGQQPAEPGIEVVDFPKISRNGSHETVGLDSPALALAL